MRFVFTPPAQDAAGLLSLPWDEPLAEWQDDRLVEAQQRVGSNSGVNLDEELTSLSSYQQAYAAGARILTVVDSLYQTLLNIQTG